MDDLEQRIARLSPAKRAILEQRLQQKTLTTNEKQGITPRNSQEDAVLSSSQQRMWFLDRLEPGNPAYNRPTNIRLTGQLNTAVLEQSLNEIIRRHEVLRTHFPAVQGQPKIAVNPHFYLSLPILDLCNFSIGEQQEKVQQLAAQAAQKSFDLEQDCSIEAILIVLNKEEHILLLTFHHIIFDGWSVEILRKELAVLYDAFISGQPSPLPKLPLQYTDFAYWQKQQLPGEEFATKLAYWKRQLGGELPILELPTDRQRSLIQAFGGARYNLTIAPSLTTELKRLSREAEATLFMTLLAAFKVLLYRYTGQEDIIVGSPVAGRDRLEIENLIGVFINTIALRTQLTGDLTFRALIARIRQVALAAYNQQDIPFEQLVEELQPKRDLSHTPIFQVLFQLRNIPKGSTEATGLKFEDLQIETGIAAFDLTLDIRETATSLCFVFEYNTDLFEAATIERMAGHLETLLQGIVANPEQPIYQIPLLTAAERHQLLVEWNDTTKDYPQDKCIHQLFEAQVTLTPDAVAVVLEDECLTYRDLNNRANQLAHHLQGLGVGPEVLVGICVERSPMMVVCLLGILKAGGAYVPLDPLHPKERLAYILSDSQAKILLTQSYLASDLQAWIADSEVVDNESASIKFVCVDTEWHTIGKNSPRNPSITVQPHNLVYIIYTSGSTGVPKGVEIEHRSLVNLTKAVISEHQLTCKDRILQFANLSFDVATEEIYRCLLSGGVLLLRTDEILAGTPQFLQKCQDWNLTVINLPTAYWQQMVSEINTNNLSFPPSVRLVIIGGESASPNSVRIWQKCIGNYPLLTNAYGPTETTVTATIRQIDRSTPIKRNVPIGFPLANNQCYILDKYLQPVPIGVPGELHIGGLGLARSYHNRPELTSEKFISNPFTQNSRLYKTGDLASYLPNGDIEFFGRIDNQVKIRGFRIELGEIQAILSQHAEVDSVLVLVREDQPGDKHLVAYLILHPQATITIEQLRSFLQQKLPNYMIPSAFILLEAFPLNVNGKVDHHALPRPERQLSREPECIPPQTPIQEIVAAIWSDVLRAPVSIHDNFFELGGHSLLATQVIARIHHTFNIPIPLRNLFEYPTVAELSQIIAQKIEWTISNESEPELLALEECSEPTTIPKRVPAAVPLASFSQQRWWFVHQVETDKTIYNRPKIFSLQPVVTANIIKKALEAIIARHEVLRTTFAIQAEGKLIQVIANNWSLELPIIDLSTMEEVIKTKNFKYLCEQERQKPFDLSQDLMIRGTLFSFNAEEQQLLLVLHHIVSDHWSEDIFTDELNLLCREFLTGEEAQLPELPIQYADFAIWQRQQIESEQGQKQLAYWMQQLGGELPVMDLPTDHPRPMIKTYAGQLQSLWLAPSLIAKLKALSRQENATLFMILLAAFKILLYRYTRQEDIIVGCPIAGRQRLETENLLGCFLNTLALRTDLSHNPSFSELLQRIRSITLQAYENQDLPFDKLVEVLQPQRDVSQSTLFTVFFDFINTPKSKQSHSNVLVDFLRTDEEITYFDLTLFLEEKANGLQILFEYNIDLFQADTIQRMMGHFETLLQGIIANPEQPIGQLPLLTAAERHQLLVEWNDTTKDYPQDKCIHQLFEAQVALTPDAVAVVLEDECLTYRELNNRANQLAHHLQGLGVGPEVLVGICVERSPMMVVCLLGILKAGGAYVPLDPLHPKERLAYILSDSQAKILLTQSYLAGDLQAWIADSEVVDNESASIKLVCMDTEWHTIGKNSPLNPYSTVQPHNLAYVIYTSGSTGAPKGVEIEHRSLVNLTKAVIDEYQLTCKDRVLQFANLSFDVAAEETYGCLLSGGMLVLRTDEVLGRISQLLQKCQDWNLTVLNLPTAYWQQIASKIADNNLSFPPSIRLVIIGGESAAPESIKIWQKHVGDYPLLVNAYGPTEATITATIRHIDSSTPIKRSVPIGSSIPNTQCYVLDRYLQPVPIGVPGELHIGGLGLARSYLNRPELTSEKFIPNPFTQNSRLYKTGDLVSYLPNGDIEFLGRIDSQVKIRGFRIELNEIQTILSQHAAISSACILAREDRPGDKRLAAYLILHQQETIGIEQLRSFLQQKLPEYMIPSAFIMLEAFPLTPNGKVDLRSLPIPDQASLEPEGTFVAPRDELELMLIEIWGKVLGFQPIGIKDNFFNLGGHSLLAVQLFSQIEQSLPANLSLTNLSLATIFQAPTVEELAKVLRHQEAASPWYSLISIQPEGSHPPLFAIHLNQFKNLLPHLGQEQPVYFLRYGLAEPINRPLYLPSMEDLAAHYIQEMRSLQPQGPYFLMGLSTGGTIAYEMAQQLVADGQQVALLALFDSYIESFETRTELLPIPQRLSNLLHLNFAEFLKRSMNKIAWNLSHLRTALTNRSTSKAQYFPHAYTSEPIVELHRAYTPKSYSGRVNFFKAMDEAMNKDAFSVNYNYTTPPPEMGVKNLVTGELEIHEVPGGHIGILEEPNVQVLAEKLKACLDRARAEASEARFDQNT
jgi:amino acid adenylation domain-containing protein